MLIGFSQPSYMPYIFQSFMFYIKNMCNFYLLLNKQQKHDLEFFVCVNCVVRKCFKLFLTFKSCILGESYICNQNDQKKIQTYIWLITLLQSYQQDFVFKQTYAGIQFPKTLNLSEEMKIKIRCALNAKDNDLLLQER